MNSLVKNQSQQQFRRVCLFLSFETIDFDLHNSTRHRGAADDTKRILGSA
jgi:hypothetical protein